MRYTEELFWILDKVGNDLKDDEKYQLNIDFVHSLGLKCDCVGWSELNLNSPDADKILDEIQKFCKENGWKARGWYTREYVDVKSDWYQLKTSYFKDETEGDYFEIKDDKGKKLSWMNLRAYHETNNHPIEWGNTIFVSERFRNVCMENGVKGVTFCWAEDKGKYEASQYFGLYIDRSIPQIACDRDLKKNDIKRIKALGGYLPKLSEIFESLEHISLPDCYLACDMPESGIAYAYCSSTDNYSGRNNVLIHKDVAEILIREKALPANALIPVPVLQELPGGYILDKTKEKRRPEQAFVDEMLSGYEKLKQTKRPVRKVTEKEVLKLFRRNKRERKEDFSKAIPKTNSEILVDTDYSPLVPYYLIANGAYLCDEYEFLSYDSAVKETAELSERLKGEELLEQKPEGVVFAKCADGDSVLLQKDGSVIRFSHEVPESINSWSTVAQFFFDSLTE